MRSLALVSLTGIMAFVSANAQETQKFTVDIGAGFTKSLGGTAAQLDNGWNLGAGFGFNYSSVLGAKLDVGVSSLGINSGTLATFGVPNGNVRIFSATIDPIVHLTPKHHVDFYLTGGGGLFHVYQEFSQPTTVVTNVFNPFFGVYPVAFGANQILSAYSVNKPGFDVGGGVAFGAWGRGKIFAEAKWDHVFMSGSHIDYLPVAFGFRW